MFLSKLLSGIRHRPKAQKNPLAAKNNPQDQASPCQVSPGKLFFDAAGAYCLINSLPYNPYAFYSYKKTMRMRDFLKGTSSSLRGQSSYFKTRAGLYGAAKPQTGTMQGRALPRTFEVSLANADIFPVLHPLLILSEHDELVSRLKSLSKAQDKDFDLLFMPMLTVFAKKAMSIPASGGMHDYESMGLFAHSLKVAANAIIVFETKEPALFNKARTAVCAALTLTALAHDLGKIETDMKIRSEEGELYRPCLETLADFAARTGTSKLYLSYIKGRMFAHEELAVKSRYELLFSSRYLCAFLNEYLDVNALMQTTQSSSFYPQIMLGSDLFLGQGRLTFKIVDPAVKLAMNVAEDDDDKICTPDVLAELDRKLLLLIGDHERVTPARTLLSHKIVRAVDISDRLSVLLYKHKHLNLLFDEAFILEELVDRRLTELEIAKAKEELNLIVMRSLMADLYQNPDLIEKEDPLAACNAEIDAMLRMVLNGMGDEDTSLDDLYQSIRDGAELSALKEALEEDRLQDYIKQRRLRSLQENAQAQDADERDRFDEPGDNARGRPCHVAADEQGSSLQCRQPPAFWQSADDPFEDDRTDDPLSHQSLLEALDATLAELEEEDGASEKEQAQGPQRRGCDAKPCDEEPQHQTPKAVPDNDGVQESSDCACTDAKGKAQTAQEKPKQAPASKKDEKETSQAWDLEPQDKDQPLKAEDEDNPQSDAAGPSQDEGRESPESSDLAPNKSAPKKRAKAATTKKTAGTCAKKSSRSSKASKDATDKAPKVEQKEAKKPKARASKSAQATAKKKGKTASLKEAVSSLAKDAQPANFKEEEPNAAAPLHDDEAQSSKEQDLGIMEKITREPVCAKACQVEEENAEAFADKSLQEPLSDKAQSAQTGPDEAFDLTAFTEQDQLLESALEMGDIEQIAGSLSEEPLLGGTGPSASWVDEGSGPAPCQVADLPEGFMDDSLAGVRLEKNKGITP